MSLVLGRKFSEAIVIKHGGEELTITVQRIRGDQVALRFDAPESFRIVRAELQFDVDKERSA